MIARSANTNFRANILRDSRVGGAAATTHFATRLDDDSNASDSASSPVAGTPAPGSDSLSGLQWDMVQIHAPEAQAITGGSPSVMVGDIDTGLDYTHPDLAANVDDANSVNCVSGAPVPGKVAAKDDNGHGTHTAGTIAAAANGIGIVGVAPNVKIAGIKAGNADGFFFPEAVVCAFMWAGGHQIKVTNNSYFADPWLFNCRNDPEQRAIWNGRAPRDQIRHVQGRVGRRRRRATRRTIWPIPTQDATSPDDTDPVLRRDSQQLCRRPGRGAGRDRRHGERQPAAEVVLLELWRRHRTGGRARRRLDPAAHALPRRTGACSRPGRHRC